MTFCVQYSAVEACVAFCLHTTSILDRLALVAVPANWLPADCPKRKHFKMAHRRKGSARPSVPAMDVPPIRFAEENSKTPNVPRPSQVASSQRSTKTQSKRSGSFSRWILSFALRITAVYTLFAALFTCSSRPFRFDYKIKDHRNVCRSLALGKKHALPIVTPWIQAAHSRVHPYTSPYIDAATPYAQQAWKVSKPYYNLASKHGANLYNQHVEPSRKKAWKKGKAYADPHIKVVRGHYKKQVQPRVDSKYTPGERNQQTYSFDSLSQDDQAVP